MIPALIQLVALLTAVSAGLRRQYPAAMLAITASLILLLIPAAHFPGAHADWERYIWFPCALVLIPAQAVAALEALFRFGERYWLVPRIAVYLSLFAAAAAVIFLHWPRGDFVGQMVRVAVVQRVGCTVFLILTCAFYASVTAYDLFTRPEGAHLLLLTAWMICWTVPALMTQPADWPTWLATDWMITARAGVMLLWVPLVARRVEVLEAKAVTLQPSPSHVDNRSSIDSIRTAK